MKAIVIDHPGSPDVLQPKEVETPNAAGGEVLIRVAYAGLNFTDIMARQGVYLTRESGRPFPLVPGTEAAGVIVAVGGGVEELAVGDRVVAFVRGACAEYAVAPEKWCWRVPEPVHLADSLCCLVQGVSALLMLRDISHLSHDETVLVHAGAGGVGSLAIQLANLLGAGKVVATASTRAKRDHCLELGADIALDYTRSDWSAELERGFGSQPIDVALDAIGGSISEDTLGVLAPWGRWIVYGLSSREITPVAGSQLMSGNQALHGFWLTSWMRSRTDLPVPELLTWMESRDLRAGRLSMYGLSDIGAAHRAMADRATVGKLVIAVA